jgi:alkyl sulfatase BDS1-like metallo-beta-lactamase superfamily hydrolase
MPNAELACARGVLDDLVATGNSLRARVAAGEVDVRGDTESALRLWDLFVDFPMFFPIVEP